MTHHVPDCTLCHSTGGDLVWQNDAFRVVLVNEPELPGFTRVISQAHVREMNGLSDSQKQAFMRAVFLVEDTLQNTYQPDKINLASLGNQTPHLHWHVIARWHEDPWFPDSIWSARRSSAPHNEAWQAQCSRLAALQAEYVDRLRTAFNSI